MGIYAGEAIEVESIEVEAMQIPYTDTGGGGFGEMRNSDDPRAGASLGMGVRAVPTCQCASGID